MNPNRAGRFSWDLNRRRRADAETRNKARGLRLNVLRNKKDRPDKNRGRPVGRTGDDSGVGYRADRAFVAGKLGTIGMYVNRLDGAYEGDEKNAGKR
jgi:hypothetical protein